MYNLIRVNKVIILFHILEIINNYPIAIKFEISIFVFLYIKF